jgi:hypothetical protein
MKNYMCRMRHRGLAISRSGDPGKSGCQVAKRDISIAHSPPKWSVEAIGLTVAGLAAHIGPQLVIVSFAVSILMSVDVFSVVGCVWVQIANMSLRSWCFFRRGADIG